MKSTKRIVLISAMLTLTAFLAGCKKPDTPDVVPTTPPTTAPTATTAPTVEPTVKPTAEPTATSTPVPTEEPVATPEPTPEPTAEPTVEPTVEPTATPTATPTIEPTKEPTATPTPKPTATPTPKPTSTPTPTPSPKPTATPVPECLHQTETVSILEDTETGTTYQSACADCGEIFEVYTIPKATATPKPTAKPKATATPKPTATPVPLAVTPTPAPSHGGVVDEYIVETGDNIVVGFPCVVYADGTRMVTSTKWDGFSTPDGYMTASVNADTEIVYHKIYYGADNEPTHEELLLNYTYIDKYPSSPELFSTLYYCMYYDYDCETEVLTSRIVNTDGSFNRYSDHVFDGYADYIGDSYKFKYENKKMVEYLHHIRIGVGYDGWEIPVDDFIYYDNKNGIVRLYEY